MRPSRSTDRGAQGGERGDALVEALVGVLLSSILVLGGVYTATRVTMSQSQARTQAMAITQLRNLLQDTADTSPWCEGAAPPSIRIRPVDASLTPIDLTVTATCVTPTGITLGGTAITAPPRVHLSVTSRALFGGNGTITVGDG